MRMGVLPTCVSAQHLSAMITEAREGIRYPRIGNRELSATMWVLGIKFSFFGRATGPLNCWASSPALTLYSGDYLVIRWGALEDISCHTLCVFLEVGEIVSCLNAFWFPRISSELFINKYSFVWICLGERERERERERARRPRFTGRKSWSWIRKRMTG